MEKSELLKKLTGTETPKRLTVRENKIIDDCLKIINEKEDEILSLNLELEEKIQG